MTTSTSGGGPPSEGTLSCLTGAIAMREGAGAVGSTFAREWGPEPASTPPPPPSTPSSLRALPSLPTPSVPALPALAPVIRYATSRRSRGRQPARERVREPALPWGVTGAFALGAALAALVGWVVERGALEIAALAAAVAGGVTLAAALTPSKHRARRRRD